MQLAGGESWFRLQSVLKGQPAHEARGRNYNKDHGEHCWGACFQAHLPSSFLRQQRPACLGMTLPTLSCSLQNQLATKKNASEIFPNAYLLEAAPQVNVLLPSSHVSLICVRLPDGTNYDNFAYPQTVYKGSNFLPSTAVLVTYCFILTILVGVI